jgi:membrane fusion protein (multidrug efflux system)
MNRNKIFIIASLLILMISFYITKSQRIAARAEENVMTVEVTPVKQVAIPLEAQAVGTLVAEKSVQIVPEIAGQVARILVKDGTFVKQGTPLIQLDDAVSKVKLASAEADLHLSEANYNRMLLLGKKGAISQQEIEKSYANLQEQKALAAEHHVMVDKMLLLAPFDGIVGKCQVSPGNYVSVGQSLISLTDSQHLRVEYSISEKYLASFKLGQTVKITTSAYPHQIFTGQVAFISPTINTQDRTLSLYADISNDHQLLKAGLFVNVNQSLGVQNNALMVPAMSLISSIDGQHLFKVENGTAHAVSVAVGQHVMDTVQVLSGLKQNDTVIIAGQQKIQDGARVNIKA